MRIRIAFTSSGKRINLDADPDMLLEEILEQLLEHQIILPPVNGDYYFHKGGRDELDLKKSLQANNVEENDLIMLAATVPDG